MNTATVESKFETHATAELSAVYSRKRGLAATWMLVDGKLTCKWFPMH